MMRVLIVENSAIIAMHLAKLVADLGHEVCARAASASDAIAQAAANLMSPRAHQNSAYGLLNPSTFLANLFCRSCCSVL